MSSGSFRSNVDTAKSGTRGRGITTLLVLWLNIFIPIVDLVIGAAIVAAAAGEGGVVAVVMAGFHIV